MRTALRIVALPVFVSISLAVNAACAGTTPVVVALSGTATPAGGTYTTFFSTATLNNAGQVAFMNGPASGTLNQNLFAGAPGSVVAVALNGAAAPSGLFGAVNTTLTTPPINGSGNVAFGATLTGTTPTRGVFVGASSLQAVALQGEASPAGGTYNVFTTPIALNNAGKVAFASTLTGASGATGLFIGTPGSLQTAAILGGTTPAGGVYSTAITAPALNNAGQVAFISLNNTSQGIFAGAPGSIQTVMLQGAAAPGTGGGTYNTPSTNFSYNNAGQVAFSSGVALPDLTTTTGVFAGAPGSVGLVALRGAPAPGGGNYGGFGGTFGITDAGQVAFSSNTMTGGPSTSGIFLGSPGAVQAVARQGEAAPISGTTYFAFTSTPIPNAIGQVAFSAVLAGSGVDTTNDTVLMAGLPGQLQVIVREGDLIDVDPSPLSDLRTVTGTISLIVGSGGRDGKAVPFNDAGYIAYRLNFTDGSAGIFVSQVPEPASLATLATCTLMLVRRRGSR